MSLSTDVVSTVGHVRDLKGARRPRVYPSAARPFLPQNNLSAAVLTNNVEQVLTDIDADNGNPGVLLRHGVLLVFGTPCQLQSLAGQEHGRTIPLAGLA